MTSSSQTWPRQADATLLLVEDDPFLASVYGSALRRRFSRVERVTDAAEAFILIAQPGFSAMLGLIIVDLHLPGISGPAFVAELAARVPGIPVLVVLRKGENADEYQQEAVHTLPRSASTEQILTSAAEHVRPSFPRVA